MVLDECLEVSEEVRGEITKNELGEAHMLPLLKVIGQTAFEVFRLMAFKIPQ